MVTLQLSCVCARARLAGSYNASACVDACVLCFYYACTNLELLLLAAPPQCGSSLTESWCTHVAASALLTGARLRQEIAGDGIKLLLSESSRCAGRLGEVVGEDVGAAAAHAAFLLASTLAFDPSHRFQI